jgi:hypothetical protein
MFQSLGGVAVIADNTWAAFKGRKALKVEWNDSSNASFESEAYKKQLGGHREPVAEGRSGTWATWTPSSPRAAR